MADEKTPQATEKKESYNSKRRIKRMNENKKVTGVLSGFAYFFQVPTLHVQIAFLIFTALTGVLPGVIIYIILSYALPQYMRDPIDYKAFCEPNALDAHVKKRKN